jgi:transposase
VAGRFEGVSDLAWQLFTALFPLPVTRGRGMPPTPFRKVGNTLLDVLRTGCRWCDLPRGAPWASKSAVQRWLQRWQYDGPLPAMQARRLGSAEERGLIQWQYGAVDGAFSPGQGRRCGGGAHAEARARVSSSRH